MMQDVNITFYFFIDTYIYTYLEVLSSLFS